MTTPTAVKLDQVEIRLHKVKAEDALPKALGYITGDMKEFANWLKGIYFTLRSSIGGNGLLVLLLKSLFILPIFHHFLFPFLKTLSSNLRTSSIFFFLMETVVLFMSE